jgi:hypothetical protein
VNPLDPQLPEANKTKSLKSKECYEWFQAFEGCNGIERFNIVDLDKQNLFQPSFVKIELYQKIKKKEELLVTLKKTKKQKK